MTNRMRAKIFAAALLGIWLAASAPGQPDDRRQRGPLRGPAGGRGFLERMKALDTDGDGKITRQEASGPAARMFSRVDSNGDGVIDQAELEKMAERLGRGRPAPGGGEGAVVGIIAPDFTLKSVDGQQEVKLSSFAGKKPVALIFGSYT